MSFLAAFFTNSAIGRFLAANVRTIITWLVIAALIAGAVFYVRHLQAQVAEHEATIAQQNKVIGQQAQELQTVKDQNLALNDQIKRKSLSDQATDVAEAALNQVKSDNHVAIDTRVAKHDDYVRKIETDTTIPEPIKDQLIAKADVDVLWGGYCTLPGVKNSTCDQYSTTVPAKLGPIPDMAPMLEANPPAGIKPMIVPPAATIPPAVISDQRVSYFKDLA